MIRDAETGALRPAGPGRAPGRHRGRPARPGGRRCSRRWPRPAGWTTSAAVERRRPAARHGLPGRGRRGGAAGAAVERHPVGAGRRRPGRRARAPQAWAEAVGSVPVASFTVTKLRWLAEHEPRQRRRTAAVCLPHDWLTWRLAGSRPIWPSLVTDRSATPAAPATGRRPDRRVPARPARPRARPRGRAAPGARARPRSAAGRPAAGTLLIGAGCRRQRGRRARARAGSATCVVSLGTSGVVCARSARATGRPERRWWPASPTRPGRFLPLVCTLNAARVLDAAARLLGVDLDRARRAGAVGRRRAPDGLVLVPYLEGERTPEPARRHRRAARPDAGQRDPREPGPGRRRGHAVRAGRRPGRAARARASRSSAVLLIGGAAQSRGGAPDRAGGVRRAGRRAGAGRVRRRRRRPAGGLGAGRQPSPPPGNVGGRTVFGAPVTAGLRQRYAERGGQIPQPVAGRSDG